MALAWPSIFRPRPCKRDARPYLPLAERQKGCMARIFGGGALTTHPHNRSIPAVYSLSQYTARVQFPDLLERPRAPLFASAIFQSKFARYFYWACAPGWALGIWLLRGRSWTLTLAAAVSAVSLSAYIAAYLYLSGNWWLPLPIYIGMFSLRTLLDGGDRRLLGRVEGPGCAPSTMDT